MMKRTTLYVIVGVVVVTAVIGGVFLLRSRQAQEPEQETRSAVVERGPMLVAVPASGSIEPQARVRLVFEVPGQVAGVHVDVGDQVKEGDVLAQLDDRQLALQVQQARAALKMADTQLAQLLAGPQAEDIAAAEANLRAAEAQVTAAAANRDQVSEGPSEAQIESSRAQVAQVELQYRLALNTHDATISNTKDKRQREQVRYDLYSAEKALAAAQAGLDELLAGANADQVRAAQASVAAAIAQQDAAQAQLDLLLAGATAEQIADVEAQVAQAQASLEQAELTLERTTLHAPFDGIVAAVNVKAGEMSPVALPAVTLLDASRFHVTVTVDEIDIGRLAKGQAAQVTLDALPETIIEGAVERIAPVASFEGGVVYYNVTIELDPTDAPIRADMTANATIVVEELTDVLVIPTWVVRVDRQTGEAYVHRIAGDGFERADVILGVKHGGFAQVVSGLSEGDELIWVSNSNGFGFRGRR
jgi:HlyD family secretion protein